MASEPKNTLVVENAGQLWQERTRREFIRLLGVGGTIVLVPGIFAACDDDDDNGVGPITGAISLDLSDDNGILNYAYVLEQLEAAFYIAVLGSAAFSGMSAELKEVFTDLRNHEVIHREFLKRALGTNAVGTINVNTTTVTSALANTEAILKAAETFEDLGVAAYNGAGKFLTSATLLTVAGKIVSVEARHAAAIRDLRDDDSFPATVRGKRFAGDDVVNPQGLDVKLEPSAVIGRVNSASVITNTLAIGTPPTGNATPDAGPPSPTP